MVFLPVNWEQYKIIIGLERNDDMLRIAVSIDGEMICSHFGKESRLVIAEAEGRNIRNVEIYSIEGLIHQNENLLAFLNDKNVHTVIMGRISANICSLLEESGLEIIKDAYGEYKRVIDAYLNGRIECKNHFSTHFNDNGLSNIVNSC